MDQSRAVGWHVDASDHLDESFSDCPVPAKRDISQVVEEILLDKDLLDRAVDSVMQPPKVHIWFEPLPEDPQ